MFARFAQWTFAFGLPCLELGFAGGQDLLTSCPELVFIHGGFRFSCCDGATRLLNCTGRASTTFGKYLFEWPANKDAVCHHKQHKKDHRRHGAEDQIT